MIPVEAELPGAVELVQNAHKMFAAGELRSAEALHDAAECAYAELLRRITQLNEREADAIEPEFTRFEKLLIDIAALLLPYSRDREAKSVRPAATLPM
jgi:hypothetical protein